MRIEKKIEVVKNWPKSKLVRNIQAFLSSLKFYRKFIRNYNRIIVLINIILQIIDKFFGNESQINQFSQNELTYDIPSIDYDTNSSGIRKSIENLSTIANIAKSKKSKFG